MANNIDVGKINWEITANADSAKKSVSGLSKEVKSLNKIFNLFKPLAFIAALKGIGTHLGNLAMKEAEFIQTQNLFNKVMGDSISKATEFRDRMEGELGFDPSEIMKSMSAFKQLTDGFGLTNDEAYLMSKNLTQLAADLTSYGYSFENAMQKLKSGLAGEIEPMRAIGVALDKNTLQQTAYSLGIDRTIDSMTRAQKTELLYYQIMTSTSKMQGELGRTMLSPANAARIMKQEFTQLGRAIGSIFIPLMMKIIPVVRAVTQILTEAAKAIAKFFGFDIGDFTYSMADADMSLGGISDGLDDVADSAGNARKEMQKMLMPFDELNNINLPKGSSSGSGTDLFGGGSLGIDLPEYDIFSTITGNMNKEVDKWKAKIEELIPVFKAAGIAAAAIWGTAKIMNFMVWLDKVRNAFSGLGALGTGVKVAFDLAFIIGGVWAQWQGTKKLLKGNFSLWSVLEALGGTALGTFGIVKVLKDTGLGQTLNIKNSITFGLGVMLAIQSIQVITEAVKEQDIGKMIWGTLEGALSAVSIAHSFGIGGKNLLTIGTSAVIAITGFELLADSINTNNWLTRLAGALSVGGATFMVSGGNILVASIATVVSFSVTSVIDDITEDANGLQGVLDKINPSSYKTQMESWMKEGSVGSKYTAEEYYRIKELAKQYSFYKNVLFGIKDLYDTNTESIKNLVEHLDKLKTSYEGVKKSLIEQKESSIESIELSNEYAKELEGLVDVNGRVKTGSEERAKAIMEKLNSALGTEYKLDGDLITRNGEVIGSYKDLQAEINETVEAKRKEIEQEVNLKLFQESIEQKAKAQRGYTKALENENNLRNQLTIAQMNNDSKAIQQLEQDLYEAGLEVQGYSKTFQTASEDAAYYSILAFKEVPEELLTASEENSALLTGLLETNSEVWKQAYDKLTDEQKTTMRELSGIVDVDGAEFEEKWETLSKNSSGSMLTANAIMISDTNKTLAQLESEIKSHQATIPKQAGSLATSTSNEFKKKLTIQDFIKPQLDIHSLIDTEKKSVITSVQGLTNDVKSNLTVDMGGYGIGSNLVKGIVDGINAVKNSAYLINSLSGLASKIGSSIRGFLGIHSPSTVMRDTVGKYIPLGIAEGIDMEADSITASMKDISERIQVDSQDFDSYLNPTFNPNINSNYTGKMEMSSDMSQGFEEATYNAMAKAITDSMSNQELSPYFNVYVGNDKLYSGYGKQQNRESNMYGIRV